MTNRVGFFVILLSIFEGFLLITLAVDNPLEVTVPVD